MIVNNSMNRQSRIAESRRAMIRKRIAESRRDFLRNKMNEDEDMDVNPVVKGVVDSALDDLALEVTNVSSENKPDEGVTEITLTVKDDGTNDVVSTDDIAEVIETAIDAAVVVNADETEADDAPEKTIVVTVASENKDSMDDDIPSYPTSNESYKSRFNRRKVEGYASRNISKRGSISNVKTSRVAESIARFKRRKALRNSR